MGVPAIAPGTLATPSLAFGAGTDTGTLNFNHTSATYVFAPLISGNGAVNVLAGTTTLTGTNSYGGATNVDAGTLRAGALNTFGPNSGVTIASRGTLDLNGFNQTIPCITNAGLVNMGTGTAPGTLLTTTSYTGTGGSIALNTFLGGDNSPPTGSSSTKARRLDHLGSCSRRPADRVTYPRQRHSGGRDNERRHDGAGTVRAGRTGRRGTLRVLPVPRRRHKENDLFLRNVARPIAPEPPGPTRISREIPCTE